MDILLEALARMTETQRSRVHVTVAGQQFPKLDATDYAALIREKGLEGCVTLQLGHVPDEALDALYQEADFCLFPYREIYGSGALLMAYSYSKPVLASSIPAFEEETDGGCTGLLFPPEEPDALKDAILRAADWTEETYTGTQSHIRQLERKNITGNIRRNVWRRDTGTHGNENRDETLPARDCAEYVLVTAIVVHQLPHEFSHHTVCDQ